MKANWKIALMCIATIAMVACKPKPEPIPDPDDDDPQVESKISVTDNSIDDWATLPAEFVVSAVCPEDASTTGLKSVKVYADGIYVNILVEPDMDEIPLHGWVPFHIYINTDNSDLTGGYGDEFADANTDILLEGAVFAGPDPENDPETGDKCEYAPAVFKWWGEVAGSGWEWTDPSVEHDASDYWGAVVGEGNLAGCSSQWVGDFIEIQFMRETVPCQDAPWSETEFGIGFDIQQAWSSVGILPQVSPTDDNTSGLSNKLQVRIDK